MSDNGVDKLIIDVEASSDKAKANLDSLVDSLSQLNNALGNLGGNKAKNGIQGISDAFKGVQSSISGINTRKLTDAEKALDSFEKKIASIGKSTNKGFNLDGKLNRDFESVGRAYRDAIEKNTDEAWDNALVKLADLQEKIKSFGKVNMGMSDKMPYVEALDAARAAQQKFYVEGAKYDDEFRNRMSKESLGKYGSLFTADKDKATMSITRWLEDIQAEGEGLSESLAQSIGAPVDAFRVLAQEVGEFKTKYKDSLTSIDEDMAAMPIQEISDAVEQASKAFQGANEQVNLFENTLKTIGKDIVASSNATELDRQIDSLEKRQQSLLSRKAKSDALGDTDTKSYQRLALDIAEVSNQLEVLNNAKSKLRDGFSGEVIDANSISANTTKIKQALSDLLFSAEETEEALKRVKVTNSGFWYKDDAGTLRFTDDVNTLAGALDNIISAKEELQANGGVMPDNLVAPITRSLRDAGIIGNDIKTLTEQLNHYKQVVADMESGKIAFDYGELQYAKKVISEIILKANELGDENLLAKALSRSNSLANELNEKLKEVKSSIVASGNENVLAKQISSAEKRLDSLLAKEDKMAFGGIDEASKQYQDLQYDIARVCDELDILYAKKEQLDWLKDGYFIIGNNSGEPQAEQEAISFGDAVKRAFSSVRDSIGTVSKFYSAIGSAFGKVKGVINNVVASVKGLGNALMDVVHKIPLLGGMTRYIEGVGHRISQLGKRMVHMLGLMVIRRALYQLLSEAKNGLSALAAYSNSIGSPFNANISNMIASLRALGYQMTAAFEPIFNYISPALDFLISKLATAINYITMFFNALTGNTTWTKANKSVGNYGASVGNAGSAAKDAAGAQKELNQQLMAWDKLNVITTPKDSSGGGSGGSGGGGGGAGGFEPSFSTEQIDENVKAFVDKIKEAWRKGDFTEIGAIIGKQLKRALDSIPWKPIQKTAEKVGKSIGTLIGGFVSVPGLARSIGTAIGQACNTVLLGLNSFFVSTPWDKVGIFLAESLGSALLAKDKIHNRTLVENFFEVIKNALNSAAELVYNFASTFPWKDLGKNIAKGIRNFLDKENGWNAYLAGASLGKLVSGIATMVYEVVSDKKNWKLLGQKIADGINGIIKETKWDKILGSVGAIISGILTALREAISKIKWGELITGLAKGIGAALKEMSAADWMTAMAIVGLPLLAKALKTKISSSIGTIALGNISASVSGIDLVGAALKGGAKVVGKGLSWIASALGLPFSWVAVVAAGIALTIPAIIISNKRVEMGFEGRTPKSLGEDVGKEYAEGIHGAITSYMNRETVQKSIQESIAGGKRTEAESNGNKNRTNVDKSIAEAQSDTSAYGSWGKKIKQWIKSLKSSKNSSKDAISIPVKLKKSDWSTVSNWVEKPKQWGKNLKNKETNLGKSAWSNVKSWVEKSSQWGTNLKNKETTLGKKAWTNVKSWVESATQWGGSLKNKDTTLGKNGWNNVKGWVESASQWGGNLKNKDTTLGKSGWSNVKGWIENASQWGGNLKSKLTTLGKSGWSTVQGYVNAYSGGNVGKGVGLNRAGWGSVQQFVDWYQGSNVGKGVGLYRDGWNTVADFVGAFMGNAVSIGVNLGSELARGMKNFISGIRFNASGGIFYGGQWHSIEGYANGGYPTSAQLFMAREAGPELVGTIGSHTAVMNNGQIVDSVAAGVAQAVAGYINPILSEMGRENRYLAEIAAKEFGISSDDVFNASRAKGREYSMRTGQQAFVF